MEVKAHTPSIGLRLPGPSGKPDPQPPPDPSDTVSLGERIQGTIANTQAALSSVFKGAGAAAGTFTGFWAGSLAALSVAALMTGGAAAPLLLTVGGSSLALKAVALGGGLLGAAGGLRLGQELAENAGRLLAVPLGSLGGAAKALVQGSHPRKTADNPKPEERKSDPLIKSPLWATAGSVGGMISGGALGVALAGNPLGAVVGAAVMGTVMGVGADGLAQAGSWVGNRLGLK